MTARNIESRIVKLEARSARPNEMLVVWRLPDGDVAEALKDATFARGDKVICAEWFDDSPPPKPRWYRDELGRAMPPAEYEQIDRTIDRIAGGFYFALSTRYSQPVCARMAHADNCRHPSR